MKKGYKKEAMPSLMRAGHQLRHGSLLTTPKKGGGGKQIKKKKEISSFPKTKRYQQ